MCGEAAPDHDGYFARVKVGVLASTYCVVVDDFTALLIGRSKEVAEMVSVIENGKEGKSASCGYLEDKLRQYS